MPEDKTLKKTYDHEARFEGGERGGYDDYDTQTEPSLHLVTELLDRFPEGKRELLVLDIGCGYGTHLRLAADRGWKCFGIEPSVHARGISQERHGDRLTVVERAEDLLPIRFDLIIMLEVIEHLQDPYPLFFTLFGRKAIGPETLVVISTPNARSTEAVIDPGGWQYRHPPSHLIFYSAKSLQVLLSRLLFKEVNIHGIVQSPPRQTAHFDDEQPSINDEMSGFLGIVAEARGSEFKEFMHERYVPGAYWKLTEYEHFPRYTLAAHLAKGARVLDFGCGTGYGTALLAEVAESVVGMDIAEAAIKWARETHRNPKLGFDLRSDLGRGFQQGSFDLVTCFEMIEHVSHEMQLETVRSIAHLLAPGGKLLISTPDPKFTAPYGDNPYHIHEMTEPEFMELLRESFRYVTMLKQWVRPSVLIGRQSIPGVEPVMFGALSKAVAADAPVGFIAICSNQPIDGPPLLCLFDMSADFNGETL
jgi:2-polyprenyl-3-methyl-5-hydroxy-6-metoxy-1,4-benzoquinol methylase